MDSDAKQLGTADSQLPAKRKRPSWYLAPGQTPAEQHAIMNRRMREIGSPISVRRRGTGITWRNHLRAQSHRRASGPAPVRRRGSRRRNASSAAASRDGPLPDDEGELPSHLSAALAGGGR